MKVCLLVLFNHRYDRNLEILDEIYKDRFSGIYYLMPFYDGNRQDVIPVYDSSFQFEGFLAQAYTRFYNEKYDYYFVVADDIVLRKEINENTILQYFGITEGECFIDSLKILSRFNDWGFEYTSRYFDTWKAFIPRREVNFAEELPDRETAYNAAKIYGFERQDYIIPRRALLKPYNGKLKWEKNVLKDFVIAWRKRVTFILHNWKYCNRALFNKMEFDFPMFCGWSDILIINKESIKKFCSLCGVFAAQRIFAEIAIPTALVQASSKIRTNSNNDLFLGTLTHEELSRIETETGFDLNKLLDNWPIKLDYMHPVKLSKWNYKKE